MDDKELERLFQTIDREVTPPEGLQERLINRTMGLKHQGEPVLTPFERFLFEKPLRTACVVSVSISGTLWAAMGSNFAKLLLSMIG